MSDILVFWLEKSDRVAVTLRRYTWEGCPTAPASLPGHTASRPLFDDAPAARWIREAPNGTYHEIGRRWIPKHDRRWRDLRCTHCGEPLPDDAMRVVSAERLYRRADTGALVSLRHAPVGAMWDADWLHGHSAWVGPDGIALHVQTPGGPWHVDGEASNCTRPQREIRDGHTYLTERTHYCWCRRGDPRDPQGRRTGVPLHVDKSCNTCAAGAGSIVAGHYHGFLHHGRLTDA